MIQFRNHGQIVDIYTLSKSNYSRFRIFGNNQILCQTTGYPCCMVGGGCYLDTKYLTRAIIIIIISSSTLS